ncbi:MULTISPECIES: cupin domain-containing protein [Thermosipho]|uniref:Cupin n=1 Tax=Thermosipho affectus TaxID=660294 RepID=A0ABX3IG22_9BACT|nr:MULTISPECIES: cupin domain-containing protein [Thermosipho]ANQ54341.1 cupin [Thermosipho sp. 1070]APT72786.1 cupin [Thermosipho sp. 1063]MBT1247412.1 cupin [Thermosipho sp. 1244]ONN26777.1 cupin [Thermosipho affectus]OOC46336.1 cupin [Thermosipho sp. 1223]
MEVKIKRPSKKELEELNVFQWPIWTKEISEFDWYYDETEICYFLEGEVEVETKDGKVYKIGKGDLVEFPKGLSCIWRVKVPVKKHYNFK